MSPRSSSRFARFSAFAWFVLAYNVATSAWGAYVRVSGSGAGCGNHWPLCNGEVVPRSPTMEMLVELTHRSTAGIASALVAALLVWGWRAYPKGHGVRWWAVASAGMIVCEALAGAALVKLGLVKDDASPARAAAMGVHLMLTFFLLAAIAVTATYASRRDARPSLRGNGPVAWAIAAPLALLVGAGATGAIAALGDTLFHSATLAEGIRADTMATAHVFVRLRALHPLLAGIAAIAVLASASVVNALRSSAEVAQGARVVRVAIVAQVIAGIANFLLNAPVGMQIVHLVLADAVWIAVVVMGARAMEGTGAAEGSGAATMAAPAE